MPKLDRSLAIGRANYQRWLGTEPEEIAAAAEVLRRFAPEHPCLLELEVRLCRARQIKAMLAEILHPERMEENDEDGGGCDGEPAAACGAASSRHSPLLRPRASSPPSYPCASAQGPMLSPTRTEPSSSSAQPSGNQKEATTSRDTARA